MVILARRLLNPNVSCRLTANPASSLNTWGKNYISWSTLTDFHCFPIFLLNVQSFTLGKLKWRGIQINIQMQKLLLSGQVQTFHTSYCILWLYYCGSAVKLFSQPRPWRVKNNPSLKVSPQLLGSRGVREMLFDCPPVGQRSGSNTELQLQRWDFLDLFVLLIQPHHFALCVEEQPLN